MASDQVALAASIAERAHAGQTDKLGVDYIEHPRRVAARFDPASRSAEHCTALLHDVVEDSDLTERDISAAGIDPAVVEAVGLLTRRAGVDDDVYYARIRANPIALAVKLADLDDNTDPARVEQLDPEVRERLARKYAHAREVLGATP